MYLHAVEHRNAKLHSNMHRVNGKLHTYSNVQLINIVLTVKRTFCKCVAKLQL